MRALVIRRSRESGNPRTPDWIPASARMTEYRFIKRAKISATALNETNSKAISAHACGPVTKQNA
jgi:hypothetical protein